MPKVDFNVPLLESDGAPAQKPKTVKNKFRVAPNGQLIPQYILDAEGHVEYEPVTVREVVNVAINAPIEGDDRTPEEVVKRGKLARKVNDITKGSAKNYSVEELRMIKERTAKIGSTELVTQLDDIIEGGDDKKEANAA